MTGSSAKKKKSKKAKSITVKLFEPIEWGEETISEVTLTRPKAKHIEHLSANPTMKELLGIAQRISGHPPALIKELDAEDAMALVEVVGDFLDSGQETGKTRLY